MNTDLLIEDLFINKDVALNMSTTWKHLFLSFSDQSKRNILNNEYSVNGHSDVQKLIVKSIKYNIDQIPKYINKLVLDTYIKDIPNHIKEIHINCNTTKTIIIPESVKCIVMYNNIKNIVYSSNVKKIVFKQRYSNILKEGITNVTFCKYTRLPNVILPNTVTHLKLLNCSNKAIPLHEGITHLTIGKHYRGKVIIPRTCTHVVIKRFIKSNLDMLFHTNVQYLEITYKPYHEMEIKRVMYLLSRIENVSINFTFYSRYFQYTGIINKKMLPEFINKFTTRIPNQLDLPMILTSLAIDGLKDDITLPDTLKYLELFDYNKPIILPQNIEHIVFGVRYNQDTTIPMSAKYVSFLNRSFNKTITNNSNISNLAVNFIYNDVHRLYEDNYIYVIKYMPINGISNVFVGYLYEDIIVNEKQLTVYKVESDNKPNIISKTLEHLEITCALNYPISIPESVTTLLLSGYFSVHEPLILPRSLKVFKCREVMSTLECPRVSGTHIDIPDGIRDLGLDYCPSTYPKNLKKLKIDYIEVDTLVLPDNLEFAYLRHVSCNKLIVPKSLTSLVLHNCNISSNILNKIKNCNIYKMK